MHIPLFSVFVFPPCNRVRFSLLSLRAWQAIFGAKSDSTTLSLFLATPFHCLWFIFHGRFLLFLKMVFFTMFFAPLQKNRSFFQIARDQLIRIRGTSSGNMVVAEHELSILDFKTTSSTCIRFSSDSSTDSQTSFVDVEWISYCPDVFRILQEYGKIDGDDYMTSVCGKETIHQLGLHGKSGSRICLPHDDRFVIRIVHKSELKAFLEKLPNYYHHVRKYKNTLLAKNYGLHVVKPSGGQKTSHPISKVFFVVMGNVLHSDLCIHKSFDVKGSHGHGSSKAGVDESSMSEDDLDIVFHLDTAMRNTFIAQVQNDCNFLEEIGATDYSLLLGIHLPTPKLGDPSKIPAHPALSDDRKSVSSQDESCQNEPEQHSFTADDPQPNRHADQAQTKLGVKMSARAVRKNGNFLSHRSSVKGRSNNIILFIEITGLYNNRSPCRDGADCIIGCHYFSHQQLPFLLQLLALMLNSILEMPAQRKLA